MSEAKDPTIIYQWHPLSGRLTEHNVERTTPKCYFLKRMGGSFHDTYRLNKKELNPQRASTYMSSYWTDKKRLSSLLGEALKAEMGRHDAFLEEGGRTFHMIAGMR